MNFSRTIGIHSDTTFSKVECPKAPLLWRVNNFLRHRLPDLPRLWAAYAVHYLFGVQVIVTSLKLRVKRANGQWVDFGTVGTRVFTTAGAAFLVDCWQGTLEPEIMKYHGIGTGSTAEAAGDTALVAESTTALNPDSTRATGSLTEGATSNIFKTVGQLTADAQILAREHGVFSQAATGGGTLLDRTVYGLITLESGDAIQCSYEFTFVTGS